MPVTPLQHRFSAGVLSPSLYQSVDLAKFASGLKCGVNGYIVKQGGFLKRPGLQFVGETKASEPVRLLPFEFNTDQTYVLELGNGHMRVIRNGAYVLTGAVAVSDVELDGVVRVVTSEDHGLALGQEVFIDGLVGASELNGRNVFVRIATDDAVDLNDMFGLPIRTTDISAYQSGGTISQIFEIETPWSDPTDLDFVQDNDTMYVVDTGVPVHKITRTADDAWTITEVEFTPDQASPTNVNASVGSGSGSDEFEYVVTARNEFSDEESLPSDSASVMNDLTSPGAYNRVTWDAVSDAGSYRIYKKENGVFRYIGFTSDLEFEDQNIDPDDNDTPPVEVDLFNSAGRYPGATTFHEGRLAFGGSISEPDKLWLSRTDAIENFTVSEITTASDAITLRVLSQGGNRIVYLTSMNELFVNTAATEWTIKGADGFLSPSNGEQSTISTRGSARVKPIYVGDALLFIGRDGETVREKVFAGFDGQGRSLYNERELTILAEHLFRNTPVIRCCYAQSPDSVIFGVKSDGKGVFLSYHREHDIWAWTECETDGEFEDCVSIPEGRYDAIYVVVKRTVRGVTKRYVERMQRVFVSDAAGAFFVDSGLVYSGSAVTEVGGLHHLEGQTVTALADGLVQPDQVVSGGKISLDRASEEVAVGLPYSAEMETLPLHIQLRSGSSSGRKKRVERAYIGVRDTRGISAGPSADRQEEYIQRAGLGGLPLLNQVIEVPIPPQWREEATVYIRSDVPLPMEITSVVPSAEIGG